VSSLAFTPFDCDNHYYEALDAFTRHADPKWAPRCLQWAEIDGRKYHVIAGKIAHAVVNPTFDPVAKAGALASYFRGNPDGRSPIEMLKARERIRPEYRDRDERVRVIREEHGLEGIWLFPTLGMTYEELLKHDPPAVCHMFQAFNRWLLEDWGFAYRDTIFGAPYLSLCDLDWACGELEWALAQGARTIVMRPAAVFTRDGTRSPSAPEFDRFWARVNEAGITVVVHAGDSGYTTHGYTRDGFASGFGGEMRGPNVAMFKIERAAYDFLITLVLERLFERFPNLRVASVENGSEFLPDLFRKLHHTVTKYPRWFAEDPAETFRRHVWINPFWEDDVNEVARLMGCERVIFGSDWPHIEGLEKPLDYLAELAAFDDQQKRRILRDNARELNRIRPA
jgi:predicted TIM-barrel fold metal-dependent hydrolase